MRLVIASEILFIQRSSLKMGFRPEEQIQRATKTRQVPTDIGVSRGAVNT